MYPPLVTCMVMLVNENGLKNAIDELLAIKRRASETEQGRAIPIINQFIESHLERLSHAHAPLKEHGQDFSVLDRLLRDTVLV